MYIKDEDKWEKENEEKNKLRKAIKNLAIDEIKFLHEWCFERYGKMYEKLITKCFNRLKRRIPLRLT